MIRLFLGFDEREKIAYHVLSHSILRRASVPVSITPLFRPLLQPVFSRQRGPFESTDFSISRFMVPFLCGYQGWAIFMDCDMLCLGNVGELATKMSEFARHHRALQVVKHDYDPKEETKFLGQKQTKYNMKNWSSMMIFNNELCGNLTPQYVNTAPGLSLHQFEWCDREKMIGTLPATWNVLVGEEHQPDVDAAQLLHFTNGGPWFPDYANCPGADLWRAELKDMYGNL